jgi:hypothetical protein
MRTVTYRGETFGEGTDISLRAVRGLEDVETETLTSDLPRYHGGIPSDAYTHPRIIEVDLGVKPSTRARALKAFQPEPETEQPLQVVWDDETGTAQTALRVNCRVQRRGGPSRSRATEFNTALFSVQLVASDPALYSEALTSESLDPFAPAAGLSYPVTYPKVYGAAGSGAGTVVTNTGDWETWPTITIMAGAGTLTDPIVENLTVGKTLELNANGGVAIASGQSLIIETHPGLRSINFDSGASRYGRLSDDSEFWPLIPGANELRFRASGSTAGATATVEFRSAWI